MDELIVYVTIIRKIKGKEEIIFDNEPLYLEFVDGVYKFEDFTIVDLASHDKLSKGK